MKTNTKSSDMLVFCVIFIAGLLTACVCFGILKSQADGKYQGYSLGGAIVGAVVSWSILSGIYQKLRKSTSDETELQNKRDIALEVARQDQQLAAEQRKNELDELRQQVADLQSKLIRGAPRPNGYSIEVAERESIVLARPAHWAPKGGTIFELELPEYSENKTGDAARKVMAKDDKFPATFRCYYLPIDDGNDTPAEREKYYDKELANVREASGGDNPFVASFSTEKIRVGGEASSIESLKIIVRQYLQIQVGPSADTRAIVRSWRMITRDEFAGRIWEIHPPVVNVGRPQIIAVRGAFIRRNAVCFIGDRKLDSTTVWLNNMGAFEVQASLTEDDVRYPGQLRITVMNPETDGFHSLPFPLTVIDNGAEKAGNPAPVMETPSAPPNPQPAGKVSATDTTLVDKPSSQGIFYQQVSRMRVLCYHEQLKRIYFFDFWDDIGDFVTSSDEFNQILASTRFLS